jgi:glycerophosphoryl diester phosphodiesterase
LRTIRRSIRISSAAPALGILLVPWTVNDRADMARLIDLCVDGLSTDYPDRLRAVLAEKGVRID